MRIDVIVVTHAGLAEAFVGAAEMIMGPQPRLRALGFCEGGDFEETAETLSGMIREGNADFTVVMTDMFGATPTNTALLAITRCENAAVVSGVNLIALIQALEADGEELDPQTLLSGIEKEGKNGIRVLTREMILEE